MTADWRIDSDPKITRIPLRHRQSWLVQWWIAWDALDEVSRPRLEDFVAIKAAQWGADQELEACCEWLDREGCVW
jgi:hypothetical protein